ncbi:MAG: TetR family transcriptional regulator [Alphaproteobacteria bacterium]
MRKTRAEKQIETRGRVLDAARELYVARGLEGVSVEAVAEAAGFSKGAVYANFLNKSDMLLAVWRAHFEGKREQFAAAFRVAHDDETLIDAIRSVMVSIFEAGPWPVLAAEIRRRDELSDLAAELDRLERAEQAELAAVVDELHRRLDRPLLMPLAALTQTLVALGEGLVLRAKPDHLDAGMMADRFMAVLIAAMGTRRA